MDHIKTVILADLWDTILDRFSATIKSVQAEDIELLLVVKLLESLKSYLKNISHDFDDHEECAM